MWHELGDKARNLGKGTGTRRDVQESGHKQELGKGCRNKVCTIAGNAIAKVCTIAYYQTVSLLLLVSSCKLQSWTKVWDTSVFLGRFPIHTGPTPPLTPQTMLDVCIQNFFRVSTLYRVGGGELQENSEKMHCFKRESRNERKIWILQYCPTDLDRSYF